MSPFVSDVWNKLCARLYPQQVIFSLRLFSGQNNYWVIKHTDNTVGKATLFLKTATAALLHLEPTMNIMYKSKWVYATKMFFISN